MDVEVQTPNADSNNTKKNLMVKNHLFLFVMVVLAMGKNVLQNIHQQNFQNMIVSVNLVMT
jgi:hypothetical protein